MADEPESVGNPQLPVKIAVVDTHCHLFLLEGEPARAVETARRAGVSPLVCVGIDPESSRRSLDLARRFEGVASTAGMHPHTASELDAAGRAELEELWGQQEVLGVGETGLDFYRRLSPVEDQEANLRYHCAVSRETGKPLVVHVREAWDRASEILEEEQPPSVVLHCFSGDATLARECVQRGYFISFAGPLTYPKNDHLREAAAIVPIDQVLVETDSPYLAPQSLRGRPNEPANVIDVVAAIAEARGQTLDVVAGAAFANAFRAFPGLEKA